MADTETRTKIVRIVYDAAKASEGVREARRSLAEIEKAAVQAQGKLDDLSRTFSLVTRVAGIFGVALSAAAAINFASGIVKSVGGLNSLAEPLATNTRYLQGLQLEATRVSVKFEDLETGLAAAGRKASEAAEGNKEAIETFDRLGVKLLDVRGQLRPLNDILAESARTILAVDDPLRRVALSTDLFDKAGRRMLPMLQGFARGQDDLAVAAERAGAMIGQDTIDKLDKLGSTSDGAGLKVRALFADLGAPIITSGLEGASKMIGEIISQLERGRASGRGFWEEALRDSRAQGRMGGLRLATPEEMEAYRRRQLQGELAANDDPGRRAMIQEDLDKFERKAALDRQASMESEDAWSRRIKLPESAGAPGVGRPTVKGAGAAEGQRYDKLIAQLEAAATAQDNMTAAARRGDVAFQEQQVKVAAAEKAIAIYGKALDETDPRLRKITELMRREMQGKAAETFSVATTELEKQNVLLQAEIDLVGQLPGIRAQELAIIKAKQEAEKAGNALTAEDVERRRAAIEQNEKLKIQAEELKKAQELWTEPLKQALRDIQTTAADAFEQMLESGKFNFESLGQVFKKIITRMIAEFLALATIRPVMSVVVNAIGGQGAASQMGLGGGMPTGSLLGGGGGGGGGGLLDMVGGLFGKSSGGGGIFGSQGLFGGAVPSTPGVMGPMQPGFLNAGSGLQMGSFGMGNLSGALGIGMGAMSLMNGGTKTTGGTIGGIGQMVGGALMMIPTPWTMAAGAIISLASSILPSLLGGDQPPAVIDQEYGQLAYGANGFGTSGGAWGPNANARNLQGPLGNTGKSMDSIFKALGGVKNPANVWGLALESYSKKDGKGWDFSNQTSFLVDPSGNKRQWGQGSTPGDVGMEAAGVAATLNSILEGAVGDISDNMRTALEGVNRSGKDTFETLGTVVSDVMAYDDALKNLGKTTTAAEQALKQVDDSFAALLATADKYGLNTTELDAKKLAERQRVGTDFVGSIDRQFMDPVTAALTDIGDERTNLLRNNSALMGIADYQDQAARIEALYARKRLEILEKVEADKTAAAERAADLAASKIQSLQDFIDRLTYGDLANASPTTAYSGTRATYMATLSQARAGNAAANERFAGTAEALANAGRSYFASGPEYAALVEQIKRDLVERQGAAVAGSGMSATDQAALNAALTANAELRNTVAQQGARIDNLVSSIAELTAALKRAA